MADHTASKAFREILMILHTVAKSLPMNECNYGESIYILYLLIVPTIQIPPSYCTRQSFAIYIILRIEGQGFGATALHSQLYLCRVYI